METLFLACFAFGSLFTLASLALGALGGHHGGGELPHGGHDGGELPHIAHAGHLPHGGHDVAHLPHAHAPGHAPAGDAHDVAALPKAGLPLFNFSSALAFMTWFGGTGYVLLSVAEWPLWAAMAAAVAVGGVGAWLVALFLAKVMAGEQVLRASDYRLEGTLARVTVTLPAGGTGEVVFAMAGARRSEAARSLTAHAVARGTEVVILGYERGVATVQPWEEFTAPAQQEPPALGASGVSPALEEGERHG